MLLNSFTFYSYFRDFISSIPSSIRSSFRRKQTEQRKAVDTYEGEDEEQQSQSQQDCDDQVIPSTSNNISVCSQENSMQNKDEMNSSLEPP